MATSQALIEELKKIAGKISRDQVTWRRHLHRHPELSFEEYATSEFLRDTVGKFGLKILPLDMDTGVLAQLEGGRPGPVVAVRSDIDALPVGERTGLDYASQNPGCMHACGHDMHMAIVLGVAAVLSELKDQIEGTVRFIFQPAEEMPPGGARPMIEQGALDDVAMIFGLHVDPHVPTGDIGLRDGVTMASVTDFDLVINGRAGHAARPQDAVDAIATACEVVDSIQKIISREIDPVEPAAITFGRIEGGFARNVIADTVTLTGTARALSMNTTRELRRRIKRTADAVCRARGARSEFVIKADYPVLKNHPRANSILRRNFGLLYDERRIAETPQVLGGEDFACYLQKVSGAMFRLGVRNPDLGADKPWHSPQFTADENAITCGTSLLAASVLDALMVVRK